MIIVGRRIYKTRRPTIILRNLTGLEISLRFCSDSGFYSGSADSCSGFGSCSDSGSADSCSDSGSAGSCSGFP